MMTPATGTAAPADTFVDLVYADDEWVRQQFDALIAAAWNPPPVPPPSPPEPADRRPGWPPAPLPDAPVPAGRPAAPGPRLHRQRSPPAPARRAGS